MTLKWEQMLPLPALQTRLVAQLQLQAEPGKELTRGMQQAAAASDASAHQRVMQLLQVQHRRLVAVHLVGASGVVAAMRAWRRRRYPHCNQLLSCKALPAMLQAVLRLWSPY